MVTLKGEIEKQEQINRAIELAEEQKGVKEVKAFLVLKPYGHLRESGKKPFFRNWFKRSSKGRAVTASGKTDNKTKLQEKNLTDDSHQNIVNTGPSPDEKSVLKDPSDNDNLDNEQEF